MMTIQTTAPARRTAIRNAAMAGIALVASVGAGDEAQALSIRQNIDFMTVALVSTSVAAGVATHSLAASAQRTANLFDPTLGNLDAVVIGISASLSSSASALFVDAGIFQTVAGLVRLQDIALTFELPGLAESHVMSDREATCAANSTFSNASCSATLDGAISYYPAVIFPIDFVLTGDVLDSYVGRGSLDVSILQQGALFVDETNGDNGHVSTRRANLNSAGRIRLTYHYTPAAPPLPPSPAAAPEPGSLALLAGGLALLIGRRRSLG